MDRLPVYDGLHTLLFNSSKTQELFKQHTLTVFINENLEKCKNLLSVPRDHKMDSKCTRPVCKDRGITPFP